MQVIIVDAGALGAALDLEKRGRHWISSCLGSMADPPLGLGIIDAGTRWVCGEGIGAPIIL